MAVRQRAAAGRDLRGDDHLEGGASIAKLIYVAICSLDGYVADRQGNFDWAEPDEEVHSFVNELGRGIGTYLFGRRMYEVLSVWDTLDLSDQPAYIREYAEMWRDADKVVCSRSLETVPTARTRLERDLDPREVERMKRSSDRDISIGGPNLAASAFVAGLVDEVHLFLNPVIVGGGTQALPDDVRGDLELEDLRRFESGVVYLRYAMP